MSTQAPAAISVKLPPDITVAILAARFNAEIVDELLAGCIGRFKALGLEGERVQVHRVPGAFELPLAAKVLAESGRYAAIVCLGCVIRGDTPHFDYVAGECARGVQQVGLERTLPVIFGVLTTHTREQALERIGGSHGHAGERAADAAAEMISLIHGIRNS